MIHSHTFKYALLALGLCTSLGACGGDDTNTTPTITYSANIQKDMVSLSCATAGCHDKNSTTPLKIDTTAGQEMTNYNNLFPTYVVKGDPTNSNLIKVPSSGVAISGATHVKTLSGTKLADWTTWITNQAPF